MSKQAWPQATEPKYGLKEVLRNTKNGYIFSITNLPTHTRDSKGNPVYAYRCHITNSVFTIDQYALEHNEAIISLANRLEAEVERLYMELQAARKTNRELNRRLQTMEGGHQALAEYRQLAQHVALTSDLNNFDLSEDLFRTAAVEHGGSREVKTFARNLAFRLKHDVSSN